MAKKTTQKDVPQLGTQPQKKLKLSISKHAEEGIGLTAEQIRAIQYGTDGADIGMTPEQLHTIQYGDGSKVEKAKVVDWHFNLRQPLVKPDCVKALPTQMRRFHEFYMEASKDGNAILGVNVKEHHFFHGDHVIWQDYKDIFEVYRKYAIDVMLMSCWLLEVSDILCVSSQCSLRV